MAEPVEEAPSWRLLLVGARRALEAAGLPSADVDARRLVEQASGHDGAELALALDDPAPRRGTAYLQRMVERRSQGEPLQYVVGRWGFRTLDLMVDRRVLIPRPETEQVAGVAVEELRRLGTVPSPGTAAVGAGGRRTTAVDLGTGSGAIALSLAVEVVTAHVWGSDVSPQALAVARANLAGLGRPGARVRLVEGDWFAALPPDLAGEIDLVVSNPPYVASSDPLPPEVEAWEPGEALVAGPSGLEHVERILAEAPAWLAPAGVVVLELAPHQAERAAGGARAAGFAEVEVRPDLAGRARILVARLRTLRRR
ncbi:MAG TPA: peptide chain release factor N(5)-glutamine methyltransferase [Acidimicrobiales bacterium]|nr:peptide chain release factor N(5)-glutamine methyltransferase [Acidimicrobiales bacterium]